MNFRTLKAEEIEVRVQQATEKGAILLLYKDSRSDMRLLDETVTPFGWQRDHKEIKGNVYCGVGILGKASPSSEQTDEWVWKWDAGTESFTEAVKGEASDSFKRACFNWGIGRELYTSPFIWVNANKLESHFKNDKGKWNTYDRFEVAKIKYNDNREIVAVAISNAKTKEVVFVWQA